MNDRHGHDDDGHAHDHDHERGGVSGLAFWLGRRPATERYTYGYGRSEDLAGVLIVTTIGTSCLVAAWEAINRLIHPSQVHHAVDPALVGQITGILSDVDGVDAVDAVRIRWVGHELHAEAEVTSEPFLRRRERPPFAHGPSLLHYDGVRLAVTLTTSRPETTCTG